MKAIKAILVCVPAAAFLAALLTAGCKSQPALERTRTDTVRVERLIQVRDTFLKTEPVRVTSYISLPCPESSALPLSLQNKHAKLTIKQAGQILDIDCLCDTATIRAQLFDHIDRVRHSKIDYQVKTEFKEYIAGYVKLFAWSGAAAWLLVLVRFIIKIYLKK